MCHGQQVIRVEWPVGLELDSRVSRIYGAKAGALHVMDSVSGMFQRAGFLEGHFKEENNSDTLFMTWESGSLFGWGTINTDQVPQDYLKVLGNPGRNYPEPFLWIQHVLDEAENRGFPFAELALDSLEIKGNLISGIMRFNAGPKITWDSVAIEGESKTRVQYLQQLSGLIPGESFSQKELERATQTLKRSTYFTLTGPPTLSFQTRQAKPLFAIRDRKSNVFDGVVGLLPNENEPGKMLVTGEVDLQLYHLGGKGRDFSVNWQRLNIQSQSLEIRAKESFVFRSPLDMKVGFSLLKQDSSFVNRSFELDFGYRISDGGYLNFFTRRKAGDVITLGNLGAEGGIQASIDYRWNQYGAGMDWNTLDSPVSPRRGGRIQSQFSLGNKRILRNTALPEESYQGLEEVSAQYQGWFSGEKHLYLKPSWGMWLRGTGGFIQNQNLFLNELYRIGGLKSIRGFNEKFFFAKRYAYLNLEQRLFFGENSYLMIFSDLGLIENPFENQAIDHPVSFGTGINLDTDGGLFSFVLALGKSNLQPLSFSYSRIHFGYLARF